MAETPKPTVGKDIAAPGSVPASATSKPVIVGHTAQVADPMVAAAPAAPAAPAAEAAPPVKPLAPPGSTRPKLAPSAEAAAAQQAADKAEENAEQTENADAKTEDDGVARVQELIDSGEYRVSIGQKTAKSSAATFLLTMLTIVIVGVVALFLLTDLKIIDLGIKLPFHIFKQ